MRLSGLDGKESRALENKLVCVRGAGESIQKPLVGVASEHVLKVFAALFREIQKPRTD